VTRSLPLSLFLSLALTACRDHPRGPRFEPIRLHPRDAAREPPPRDVGPRVERPFDALTSAAVVTRDEVLGVQAAVGVGTLYRLAGGRWETVALPTGLAQLVVGSGRDVSIVALELPGDAGAPTLRRYRWIDGRPVAAGTLPAGTPPLVLHAGGLPTPGELVAGGTAPPRRPTVVRFVDGRGQALVPAGSAPVECVVAVEGEAWVSFREGAPVRVRQGSVQAAPAGTPRHVCASAALPDGTLLLGGADGLWARDPRGELRPEIGVQGWSITALTVAGGTAWAAGSEPGQFARREGPRWRPVAAPAAARTLALAAVEGALVWVGEDGEVVVR
jgi:hypothetical protein